MKKLVMYVFALTFLFASSVWSEEIPYRKHIKPVFDAKCIACHGANSAPEYYAFKESLNYDFQELKPKEFYLHLS